jgi:hypothetical protein
VKKAKAARKLKEAIFLEIFIDKYTILCFCNPIKADYRKMAKKTNAIMQ